MWCDVMRCDAMRYDTIRCDTIRYDMIWYDMTLLYPSIRQRSPVTWDCVFVTLGTVGSFICHIDFGKIREPRRQKLGKKFTLAFPKKKYNIFLLRLLLSNVAIMCRPSKAHYIIKVLKSINRISFGVCYRLCFRPQHNSMCWFSDTCHLILRWHDTIISDKNF